MTFGEKLLELRKQNNFSQEELAEKLGVSRQAISRWESGETMPDSPNLLQISKIFSVGVKCKSVFKSTEILESNNKKNSCANGSKIVENGTEDFPDKNSPAFNKVFKCGDLLVSTAFLGAFKYFKRICGSVAVR